MSNPNATSITNERVTTDQRRHRAERWLGSLDLLIPLVEPHTRKKVEKVQEFGHNHINVAEPITSPDGQQWGARKYSQPVGLVPLFTSDLRLHQRFEQQKSTFSYDEQAQVIFLPPRKISPLWAGVVAFHEISHAINHAEGTYRKTQNPHWVEEVDVFRNESEILVQIYGDKYDLAVNDMSDQFSQDLELQRYDGNPVHWNIRTDGIDHVMAPSFSNTERGMKVGAAIIDATFRALDSLGRDDHAHITQFIYGH